MSTSTSVSNIHNPTTRPRLWTPEELAEYLGVTLHCVYAWSSKGRGPRVLRVGARLRYRPADVDEWLDRATSNEERG